jgi:acyl-CoA dehydrogenase
VHERAFHETGKIDPIVRKTLVENGYFAMALPEEYGGLGLGALAQAVVQIELARLPPQFWTELRPLMGRCQEHHPPWQRGTEGPACPAWRAANRHCLCADRAQFRLRPRLDADHGGAQCRRLADQWQQDLYFQWQERQIRTVYAYTDKAAGPRGGITAPDARRAPGYSVTGTIELMGTASPGVFELAFDNCQLPEDAVIGEIGRGFHYALKGLNEGRMNVGATAVGMGEYALELAIEGQGQRFGGGHFRLPGDPSLHCHDGDRHARGAVILLDAAWRYDQGEKRELASMAKLFATEAGSRTVDTALQIFGGSGYCKGFAIERLYRDIRITRIYEGSSEIQRNTIARELLR